MCTQLSRTNIQEIVDTSTKWYRIVTLRQIALKKRHCSLRDTFIYFCIQRWWCMVIGQDGGDGTSTRWWHPFIFAYEENAEQWLLSTTVDQDEQGPLLRARLKENALTCKKLLHPERIQQAGAVKCWLDTLRPFFMKENSHVFLWHFLRLFKVIREKMGIIQYVASTNQP